MGARQELDIAGMPMRLEAAEAAEPEISLLDVVRVLAESWKLIVFGALAVGLTTLGLAFLITPVFTARTTLLPPQQQGGAAGALAQLGALAGVAAGAAGLKNPADQYVAMLRSRSVADAMVDRFSLQEVYGEEFRTDALRQLEQSSRISAGKDGLIVIEVDDTSPPRAAQMANAFVEEFDRLLDRLAVTEAKQRRVFFEKQLQETNQRLAAAQKALRASGVDASTIKLSPQAAVEAIARLKAQVTAHELRIASMRGYLAEGSPDLRQALGELVALRAQLRQAEAAEPPAAGGQTESDYVTRYRDLKYQETLFELFARQFEMAKVDEAREGSTIQVVDRAITPEKKAKPKKALMAIVATVLGGLLLVVFCLLREVWRSASRDPASADKVASIRHALRLRRPRHA
jgi:tyrosine-protein kinase Etk/Wzc